MSRWLMVGELEVKHRVSGLEYYPEDEHRARGWKLDTEPELWAQATLLPVADKMLGMSLARWMTTFGYLVQVRTGREWFLVLCQHPLLDLRLVSAWATPMELR